MAAASPHVSFTTPRARRPPRSPNGGSVRDPSCPGSCPPRSKPWSPGSAGPTGRGAKPDNPAAARTRGRLHHRPAVFRIPCCARVLAWVRSRDPFSATPTPHWTPTRSTSTAGCARAISGRSMQSATSALPVASGMRSSATRRMFRPSRSKMCSPPIPRSPTSQSSASPTAAPASAYAPWWCPRQPTV
jgi:hypothetical protein